jgi:hypothetical protein
MSENVVALPGFSVPRAQGEPIERLIEICEELLAEAKTGKLRAVGIAKVIADPQMLTEVEFFSGPSPDRYALVSAVRQLDCQVAVANGWTGVDNAVCIDGA